MNTNIQQSPYLRAQRNFPSENLKNLAVQMDLAYIDIASKVNARTVGIFALNVPIVNGEEWYLKGTSLPQQALRQIYSISSYTSFNHNINFAGVSFFTKISGVGFDGTNYFPLPFVNGSNTAGQVEMYVSPSQVVFVAGGSAPAIQSGIILLEWVSLF